jgi:hypothetical protein
MSLLLTSSRRKAKQVKNKISVNCSFCQDEFSVWKSKFLLAQRKFHGNLYCSRDCSRKAQPALYDKFNWCDLCNKWILKEESVFNLSFKIRYKKKKNHHCYCPRCNNELRTSKKYNRSSAKLRQK